MNSKDIISQRGLRKYISNYIRSASLYTLTSTHLTLIYVCSYIRLSVSLGCFIKQAGRIIHTAPVIEPVTSSLTNVYKPATLPPEPFRHLQDLEEIKQQFLLL